MPGYGPHSTYTRNGWRFKLPIHLDIPRCTTPSPCPARYREINRCMIWNYVSYFPGAHYPYNVCFMNKGKRRRRFRATQVNVIKFPFSSVSLAKSSDTISVSLYLVVIFIWLWSFGSPP